MIGWRLIWRLFKIWAFVVTRGLIKIHVVWARVVYILAFGKWKAVLGMMVYGAIKWPWQKIIRVLYYILKALWEALKENEDNPLGKGRKKR